VNIELAGGRQRGPTWCRKTITETTPSIILRTISIYGV